MSRGHSELARVIEYPIACGHCGEETLHIIGQLVDRTDTVCGRCHALLDLNTKELASLRDTLKELYVGKYSPVVPVKQQP